MNKLKSHPLLVACSAALIFGLLNLSLNGVVGFTYGENSAVARVSHDVGMMLWGGIIATLFRWAQIDVSKPVSE